MNVIKLKTIVPHNSKIFFNFLPKKTYQQMYSIANIVPYHLGYRRKNYL